MFQISEPHVCNAYYCPLSNFLKISGSSNDEKRMRGEEEGQEAGAEGGVEVISGIVVLKLSVFALL